MDNPTDPQRLAIMAGRLAKRLESNPGTMAWVIARYREAEGMDDRLVAVALGIEQERLPHLALCNRPRPELFSEDVETIADHIGIEQERLADLVRRVEALSAFGQLGRRGGRAGGLLAAARDRAAEEPAPYSSEAKAEDGGETAADRDDGSEAERRPPRPDGETR